MKGIHWQKTLHLKYRFHLTLLFALAATLFSARAELGLSTNFTESRMLEGQELDRLFTVSNSGGSDIDYTTATTGLDVTYVNDLGVGTASTGLDHLLTITMDSTGETSGSTVASSLSLNPTPSGTSATQNFDVNVLQNRPLTGTATYDLGRFINNSWSGSLTVDGGALSDAQATRVRAMSGGYRFNDGSMETIDNEGNQEIYLNAPTNFDGQALKIYNEDPASTRLDSANETVTYRIEFESGSPGEKDITLSGNDFTRFFTKEGLAGEQLDLSGLSVDITGTALRNRSLAVEAVSPANTDGSPTSGEVRLELGRRMVSDGGSYDYSGSETIRVSSAQSDSTATRVLLNDGSVTDNGVTVTNTASNLFDGNETHDVSMSYNITFDENTAGRQTRQVSLVPLYSSGEAGGALLTGQSLPSSQNVGVSLDVVEDRVFTANDVNLNALVGYEIDEVTGYVGSSQDDFEATRVTVTTSSDTKTFTGAGSVADTFLLSETAGFSGPVTSTTATSLVNQGTKTLGSSSFAAEGLDGETVQTSVSYDVKTQFFFCSKWGD